MLLVFNITVNLPIFKEIKGQNIVCGCTLDFLLYNVSYMIMLTITVLKNAHNSLGNKNIVKNLTCDHR